MAKEFSIFHESGITFLSYEGPEGSFLAEITLDHKQMHVNGLAYERTGPDHAIEDVIHTGLMDFAGRHDITSIRIEPVSDRHSVIFCLRAGFEHDESGAYIQKIIR
jgi:hypothetical protein